MKLLLMAGASETNSIARALASAGFSVIVSTVTDFPLEIEQSEKIYRRVGGLSAPDLIDLCEEEGVVAIVDATHPYAAQAHKNVRESATQLNIPSFRYDRPCAARDEQGVHSAASHDEAARIAVSFGRPVLLTSGTRNLEPYISLARTQGVELFVRALDCQQSRETIKDHDIPVDHCEFALGPFSVEDNKRLITKFDIGVLVTKDGGLAGGLPEKLEAAKTMACEVVLVKRPQTDSGPVYNDVSKLVDAVKSILP